jgi:Zn finger protein HypA/HybF involved in hydrogenase expression
MTLSTEQIQTLVGLIVTTKPDQISCDDCFGQIGEFAEKSLEGRALSEGMQLIQTHLTQCPCCKGEYEGLLDALKEIDEEK